MGDRSGPATRVLYAVDTDSSSDEYVLNKTVDGQYNAVVTQIDNAINYMSGKTSTGPSGSSYNHAVHGGANEPTLDSSQSVVSALGGQDANAMEFVGPEVHAAPNAANNAMERKGQMERTHIACVGLEKKSWCRLVIKNHHQDRLSQPRPDLLAMKCVSFLVMKCVFLLS